VFSGLECHYPLRWQYPPVFSGLDCLTLRAGRILLCSVDWSVLQYGQAVSSCVQWTGVSLSFALAISSCFQWTGLSYPSGRQYPLVLSGLDCHYTLRWQYHPVFSRLDCLYPSRR
jgi:hypothetical protein